MAPRFRAPLAVALLLASALPVDADVGPTGNAGAPYGSGFVGVGSFAYLVGGHDPNGVASTQIRRYDPVTRTTTLVGHLAYAVDQPGVTYAGGRVHVFGGSWVQTFDPANLGASTVAYPLPQALEGPVVVLPLAGASHFLLVGTATQVGGDTQLRVARVAGASVTVTTNATLPFSAPHPPVVATSTGIYLFHSSDVYRLDLSAEPSTSRVRALAAPAGLVRQHVGAGSAVANATHVTIFDDTARAFVWTPPAAGATIDPGARVLAEEGAHGQVPRASAVTVGTSSRYLYAFATSMVVEWTLPALTPAFHAFCDGTLVCRLRSNDHRYFRDYEWTVGSATLVGHDAETTFPQPGTYSVQGTVRDALGRVASVRQDVHVTLNPPNAWFHYACGAKRDCRFDGRASGDDGHIVAWSWTIPSLNLRQTGPLLNVTFPEPTEYRIQLTVRDNIGLESQVNQTINATGAPVFPDPGHWCYGLVCEFWAWAQDDHMLAYSFASGLPIAPRCTTGPTHVGACPVPPGTCRVDNSSARCSFPRNGTWQVSFTAREVLPSGVAGNASSARFRVAVENLPPFTNAFPICDRATRRCTAFADTHDPEETDVRVRWEPARGVFSDGPTLNHSYLTEGLKIIRLHLTDGHGWTVVQDYPVVIGDAASVNLRATVRPVGSSREPLIVLLAVDAPRGAFFEEAVKVTLQAPVAGASPGEVRIEPRWSGVFDFTTGKTQRRVAIPAVAPGVYTVHVEAAVSRQAFDVAIEVTSWWG